MNEATPTPDASTGDALSWMDRHRDCWRRKPALRWYYETQIFDRIISRMNPGETLELGSGPGFFASYRPGMVSSDIMPTGPHVVEADAHDLPFEDGRFSNVVGVDVLHHLARPGRALRECARVLQDGGRIILVEPWPSTFGWFFYRYIHHEDCRRVADPWERPFAAGGKRPLDGNAMIPWQVVEDCRQARLPALAPGLRLDEVEAFGSLSFLLTGGFQSWGFPLPLIRFMTDAERRLPRLVLDRIATRALCTFEKGREAVDLKPKLVSFRGTEGEEGDKPQSRPLRHGHVDRGSGTKSTGEPRCSFVAG